MESKTEIAQSIGLLFIRWNFYNRVCVAVSYFENGEMIFMKVDKDKILKLCLDYLPKEVTYEFVSEYPLAMNRLKISEQRWNEMAYEQNGLLEIYNTRPISIIINRTAFNKMARLYLK